MLKLPTIREILKHSFDVQVNQALLCTLSGAPIASATKPGLLNVTNGDNVDFHSQAVSRSGSQERSGQLATSAGEVVSMDGMDREIEMGRSLSIKLASIFSSRCYAQYAAVYSTEGMSWIAIDLEKDPSADSLAGDRFIISPVSLKSSTLLLVYIVPSEVAMATVIKESQEMSNLFAKGMYDFTVIE